MPRSQRRASTPSSPHGATATSGGSGTATVPAARTAPTTRRVSTAARVSPAIVPSVPATSTRALQLAAQLARAQPQDEQVALGADVAHRPQQRGQQPEDRERAACRRGRQQGAEHPAGDRIAAERPLHVGAEADAQPVQRGGGAARPAAAPGGRSRSTARRSGPGRGATHRARRRALPRRRSRTPARRPRSSESAAASRRRAPSTGSPSTVSGSCAAGSRPGGRRAVGQHRHRPRVARLARPQHARLAAVVEGERDAAAAGRDHPGRADGTPGVPADPHGASTGRPIAAQPYRRRRLRRGRRVLGVLMTVDGLDPRRLAQLEGLELVGTAACAAGARWTRVRGRRRPQRHLGDGRRRRCAGRRSARTSPSGAWTRTASRARTGRQPRTRGPCRPARRQTPREGRQRRRAVAGAPAADRRQPGGGDAEHRQRDRVAAQRQRPVGSPDRQHARAGSGERSPAARRRQRPAAG